MANNNFCVWSSSEEYGYLDISLGGCKLVGTTTADAAGANTTMGFNSGKWYSEYYMLSTGQSSYPYLNLSSGNNAEDPGSNTGFRGEIRFHAKLNWYGRQYRGNWYDRQLGNCNFNRNRCYSSY